MVSYECIICNYSTNIKSHLNRHLKTKKHRVNEETRRKNINENDKNIQKHPQNIQKHPQNIHKKLRMYPCNYCEETFTNFSNKRRNELHRCKENTNVSNSIITNQGNQIKKLEKAMENQKKEMAKHIELLLTKVGNNYTTINNTNTNNIQLNNYGSEDLSHITDALKTYLIKHPFGAIQQLIEKIHFNRDKPENINLMITNKRDNKISVYEDGKWVYRNKKKTIQRLIDNKYYILDDHYNDIDEKELSEFNHTNYKSFSEKMDENDKQLLEQLYEDAEIIILNKQ